MEILAKLRSQRICIYGVFRKGDGIWPYTLQFLQQGNSTSLHPGLQKPQGVKEQSGPRSEKLTMPPAGGRKSLLTPAQPGSGAFLLSEKLILEICTELFIVNEALLPIKSRVLGKKSCCAGEALPPIGDPP